MPHVSAAGSLTGSPPVASEVPTDQTAIQEDEIRLPCVVSGKPTPDVYWKYGRSLTAVAFHSTDAMLYQYSNYLLSESEFDGTIQNLGTGGRFTINQNGLVITAAEWLHSGRYTCYANNSLDSIENSAQVTVYSKSCYQIVTVGIV